MLSDSFKSYLHLHLIVFIWGFTAILGALISLDALPLVWFRMSLAVVFISLYIYWKKLPLKVSRKFLMQFIFAGFIIALHWFTFFKAIKVSNVSVTLACLSTGAFFASFLEPILFGKKIIWYEVFLGLLVVLGLYIIFNVEGNYFYGILLALTSAFLSALFSVINSKFVKTHDATIISFYELSGGVLFFSVLLLFGNQFSTDFFSLTFDDLKYLIILSSICTAYAFIASTSVMKHLSAYTVMLTINLEPIYGIILAVILFKEKEKMSVDFYIGALLILFTVLLNIVIKTHRKKLVEH
ncbi:DMT family transporter [Flavobacterium capsici]|uniref:DMT family transporter n=1 Tax=Flavobacterium capsici TaxID=3075618 RepID=A0AA96J272_9FLAO|nr:MULTISPECIES: DMT family transporter [unclassified Flavobacterium]WNM17908.1 DMT family transporter [Flavobacterium sp. PMR2A8]WNM23171.1 DMT family transporter [Flavobacterium sp. PMTSA4]